MFIRSFFMLLILTISCGFNPFDPFIAQGNVIYSFASGRMQCQSEIDAEGHTFVLLKSLDNRTQVKFVELTNSKNSRKEKPKLAVKLLIEVDEKTNLCASWKSYQEVTIVLDPLRVKKNSLIGQTVYKSDQITVMILDTSN
jgi:hypothetical protein